MKKILLTLIILIIFTNKVEAQEYSIPVTYNIAPTYTLRLPSRIDVSNNSTDLIFYLKADIYMDQTLNIEFDKNAQIVSNKTRYPITVYPYKYTFTSNDLSDSFDPFLIKIVHDELQVGNYGGQLNFQIYLGEIPYE